MFKNLKNHNSLVYNLPHPTLEIYRGAEASNLMVCWCTYAEQQWGRGTCFSAAGHLQ